MYRRSDDMYRRSDDIICIVGYVRSDDIFIVDLMTCIVGLMTSYVA